MNDLTIEEKALNIKKHLQGEYPGLVVFVMVSHYLHEHSTKTEFSYSLYSKDGDLKKKCNGS